MKQDAAAKNSIEAKRGAIVKPNKVTSFLG